MAEAPRVERVYRLPEEVPPPRGPRYVTIGKFDGVHVGHQAILRSLVEDAAAAGGEALAVTFEPHPEAVLLRLAAEPRGEPPAPPPARLTLRCEKLRRLAAAGVRQVLELEFTPALAAVPAERFARDVVGEQLRAAAVYVGHDFTFGHRGAGTPALLEALAPELGLRVRTFPPVRLDGEVVSATAIRALLAQGAVEQAARWLGRPHVLYGAVLAGAGRGRSLGIPTANLEPHPQQALPATGVYAAWAATVAADGAAAPAHRAVVNVGHRPTFGGGGLVVEAHLLDFDGDLYGREVGLHFIRRLRDERRFESVAALVTQIRADVAQARRVLRSPFVARMGPV